MGVCLFCFEGGGADFHIIGIPLPIANQKITLIGRQTTVYDGNIKRTNVTIQLKIEKMKELSKTLS